MQQLPRNKNAILSYGLIISDGLLCITLPFHLLHQAVGSFDPLEFILCFFQI